MFKCFSCSSLNKLFVLCLETRHTSWMQDDETILLKVEYTHARGEETYGTVAVSHITAVTGYRCRNP